MPICSRIRPITAKKYLRVAFIDGVASAEQRIGLAAARRSASSLPAPCSHSMAAMPAEQQHHADDRPHGRPPSVSVLPTSGSCGQLLV